MRATRLEECKALERSVLHSAFGHLVCSAREQKQLRSIAPQARIEVIENGVDAASFTPANEPGSSLVFVGTMDYFPNIEAAVSFARTVWPVLCRRFPRLTLAIVGANPVPEIRALSELEGVTVTGTVPDVRPYYRDAFAAIVPLRSGGGTRLKVLEAMAAGVPVISSTLGAEGLAVSPDRDILMADPGHPEEWVRFVETLFDSPDLRSRIIAAGRDLAVRRYDWEVVGRRLFRSLRIMGIEKPVTPLRLLAVIEATSITGPDRNLLEFARLAQNEHIEKVIATFSRGGSNLFIDTVLEKSIPLEVIEERKPNDPAAQRALLETIRRVSPDVLQTHAVKSHFLIRRIGADREFPWVAFHHGYTWPDLKARLYNQLDRWSLRSARRVLTVSQPFRAELVARGVSPERIEIIHNAIAPGWGAAEREPVRQAETRRAFGIPPDRKVVLIVGRLSREKDHLTLLEATKRTQSAVPAHLVIVGEGPERPRIEERIRQLGLQNEVTLTGQQNSAAPFYGIADLAVLSSLSEGSPNALLEALVCGVPAVATRVGGIPEIVRDGETALLVPPSDVDAMATAQLPLLGDEALWSYCTDRGKTLIAERHSPEARVRRLSEIYRSMALLKLETEVPP